MRTLKSIVLCCLGMAVLLAAGCESKQRTRKVTIEGPDSKTEVEVKTTDRD